MDIKKTEIGTTKSIAPAQIGAILASAILKEVIAGKIKFEPDQKKDDYIQDFINLYAPESKKPVEMTKKKNSQQDQGEST